LARDGFYDNVPFTGSWMLHAQTGDGQNFNGTGGSKYPTLKAGVFQRAVQRGIVGMARACQPR